MSVLTTPRPSGRGVVNPALYLTGGLAGASGEPDSEVLADVYAYGSLSMTAYTLGLSRPDSAGGG
jgi:4,5-DOPA dioxygenase extradiol